MADQDLLDELKSFSESFRLPGISDRLQRIMLGPMVYLKANYGDVVSASERIIDEEISRHHDKRDADEIAYEAGRKIAKNVDNAMVFMFTGDPNAYKELDDDTKAQVAVAVKAMQEGREETRRLLRYLMNTRFWQWHKRFIDNWEIVGRYHYRGLIPGVLDLD